MKILLFFMTSFLFLSSCSSERPLYLTLAHKHISRYSKRVAKSEGLFAFGSGGQMGHNVKVIRIYYACHRMITIEQARQLYIPVVEGMIEQVNDDPEIRPFLDNYPVTNKNISLSIGFWNKDKPGHIAGDGLVAFVCCVKGNVCYAKYNPQTDLLEDMYEEPYEVAKSIVMGNDSCSEAALGDPLECRPGA